MNPLSALLLGVILAGACLLIVRERKKYALRLRKMQAMADARIREARIQSEKETREKIGRDLHDELSAMLAGVVHQVELLSGITNGLSIKQDIDSLRDLTNEVYRSVRDKSHLLYFGTSDTGLDQGIKRMAGFFLPDSLYRKEIEIDPNAAAALNEDQKPEILRIVQEAVVNIRKHAKEATEVFVFLYENSRGEVILQVGDNGKVFKKHPGGIGLKSIRKRVHVLKGKFSIENGEATVITIHLPSGHPQELKAPVSL